MSKLHENVNDVKGLLRAMKAALTKAEKGDENQTAAFVEKLEKVAGALGLKVIPFGVAVTGPVTEMELIYIKAMKHSNFNDGEDKYREKGVGVFQFSVCDEIKEYTALQARGVVCSLIRKGLVETFDTEGKHRPKDMAIWLTDKGVAVEQQVAA